MRSSRPYRSRRIPACVRCRKQRTKCTVEEIGQDCLQCRKSSTYCSSTSSRLGLGNIHLPISESNDIRSVEAQPADLHVVPPVVARDTQVLEGLLPTTVSKRPSAVPLTDQQYRPIYHVSIPPRRPSPTHCDCSRNLTQTFVQQTEPYIEQLLELYMRDLHPCLPISDSASLRSYLTTKQQSTRTFLVNFAAYVFFYANRLPSLAQKATPDHDFAWQVACSELDGHIQSGGVISIMAAVLCIAGRPSKGVIHNMTNVARIVALSNSIGLNHDCSKWVTSEAEQKMRKKLWWAVLIHDRWFHFAQGTPPLVNSEHYDVPVPTIPSLVDLDTASKSELQSAECYIALCKLTEIVGDVLPLVYQVRSGTSGVAIQQISRSKTDLDTWLNDLPGSTNIFSVENRRYVPGLVNLQLAYLSVQMLLERLAWHESGSSDSTNDESMLEKSQAAAESVVEFITSLVPEELSGFWLPYNAQHFTSAVTLLLRCALQTKRPDARSRSIDEARTMVRCLRDFSKSYSWDLAEIALPQSELILGRIEEALPGISHVQSRSNLETRPLHTQTGQTDTVPLPEFDTRWSDLLRDASLEELFPDVFSSSVDYSLFDHAFLGDEI